MAELCEICLKQLVLWEDYVTIEYDAEPILCLKCQKEVDDLYDKHNGRKDSMKCVEEVRKIKQKENDAK